MDARSGGDLSYPPGPRGYSLIRSLPRLLFRTPPWEVLLNLSRQHETDVFHLKLPAADLVILSTSEAVSDLFDRRSAIYSDKPSTPVLQLAGFTNSLIAFMPYGPELRTHRSLLNNFLNSSKANNYDANQVETVSKLLVDLHRKPEAFREHVDSFANSFALSITCGIRPEVLGNDFFHRSSAVFEELHRAALPGAFLVDVFPVLRHLPSWFPCVEFHAFANKVREDLQMSQAYVKKFVARRLISGDDIDTSMASMCMENLESASVKRADMEVISNTLASSYGATSRTLEGALGSFFLAMTRNTNIMRAAQRQLDGVVGGRLPNHSDIYDLPYIVAIVKETLRWSPPLPIGGPRRLMKDDVYRGTSIPRGAVVVEDIWAMCHDETKYLEPQIYNPARFLDKDGNIDPSVKDPESMVFGAGRRICPGRRLGSRVLFLAVARILAAFDILPPVENGRPRIPEAKFSSTIFRRPLPFECIIRPRSKEAVKLMYDAVAAHQ